jgi:hypothetical protein
MVPAVKSWPGAAAVEEEEERMDFAPATVTSSSKLEDKTHRNIRRSWRIKQSILNLLRAIYFWGIVNFAA